MYELQDIDYEILAFLSKKEKTTGEEVRKGLSHIAVAPFRLAMLSNIFFDFIGPAHRTCSYTCVIHSSQGYELTPFGKACLQDYQRNLKIHRREMWLKNAWIPILVSLVANLVVSGIKWLLPLIQQ